MERSESASVVIQVMATQLAGEERDRIVHDLIHDLQDHALTPAHYITPLMDKPSGSRYGVQLTFLHPEDLIFLVQTVSDFLAEMPVLLRLTFTVNCVRLQVQTSSAETLLGIVPTLATILPAQQTFQARAELYAYRGGDLSPVEQANLELLRHRLNLEPDEAERIVARALGPYRHRHEKLEKYREVLNAEYERQGPPLSETTWAELRRLARSLGLAYEDVAAIDQEYVTRLQAEVTLLQQREEATRLQEQTLLQESERQAQLAAQHDFAERYRQEFATAIATTLYPSEFDRGRLEQARRTWELEPEQVRAIEREVTDARYGAIDSDMGIDYGRLRQLLWLNQWEVANQETERLILMALSQDMKPLEPSTILKLSCTDLLTLDQLWSRYSQGKFGFLAQYQVYVQQERRSEAFLQAVGWKGTITTSLVDLFGANKPYRELQFSLAAPLGHLPTWRWIAQSLEDISNLDDEVVHNFFTDLVERCLPGLKASAATAVVETPQESLS